jgi:exopolysaccharide biosynthesis polyprenyl glycosylphosphotransferase
LLPEALRFGAVIFPVAGVLLATRHLGLWTLVTAVISAVTWFAALKTSYLRMRLSPLAPGTGLASLIGAITGLAALSVVDLVLPNIDLTDGQLLLMAAGVAVTSATFERIGQRFEPPCRVLIVGASDGGLDLLRDLEWRRDTPFDCLGIVHDGSGDGVADRFHRGTLADLGEIVIQERPDLIVLGNGVASADALHRLIDSGSADFRVVGLLQFYEHAFGQIPVKYVRSAWFMGLLHLYQRPYSRITKRIFDLTLAALGLALIAPFVPVLALLVRGSGPGPIIFRQVRLGEGGKTFEILKFRTMTATAEENGEAVWATEDDLRVTRIGSFLRKTRLDECPQLWNVIRGEMSVVGPRPERPEFLDLLRREVPFWTSRHLIKPGVTGWAQVHRGYTSDAAGAVEKLAYDLYYLRHRSLLVDLAVVVRTARVVGLGFFSRRRRSSRIQVDETRPNEGVPAPLLEDALMPALIAEGSSAREGGAPPSP